MVLFLNYTYYALIAIQIFVVWIHAHMIIRIPTRIYSLPIIGFKTIHIYRVPVTVLQNIHRVKSYIYHSSYKYHIDRVSCV